MENNLGSVNKQFLLKETFEIRRLILEMAHQSNGAHIGGALSSAEILSVLFHHEMRLDPNNPSWENRDYFILSKGHIAVGLYSVLIRKGFIPKHEHTSYAKTGSRLGGHPSHELPGVEFSTGALGHGLSLGIGMAMAARLKELDNRTFVLMGDGELQEGTVYEAASAASRFNLGNLTAVIDRNDLQINGTVEQWLPRSALSKRWGSFGWDVQTINGNDVDEVVDALAHNRQPFGKPRLIIANTTKANGIEFMENNKKSHSVVLNDRLYQKACAQLKKKYSSHK